ncbi:choice-of-anchor P family protein [Amycolatopsis sp. SID8362]|uniref:choice-of-anchor P family protein n=1 Tax=Amycolatopsis sp. SID8362 TaxID=2690346 RepID=UPI00136F64A4|nr:choice-of-anchor P family protein [Amycolatopsis sp. SID8362]NBH11805.1 hypothetical protein [Amycolatopsis sp. SID8362]NED48497.1 hypothetical protein [Amycolatopsis sp. SID8362]
MRVSLLRSAGVVGLATVGVFAAVVPAQADAPGAGSAYGASLSIIAPDGSTVVVAPTGKLAPSSTAGPTSASAADIDATQGRGEVYVQVAGIASGSARDSNTGNVTETGKVGSVALLTDSGGEMSEFVLVGADSMQATCATTAAGGITGSSTFTNTVGGLGEALTDTAHANTRIDLPSSVVKGTAVVNEQIMNSDGSLTVNALHITLTGGDLGTGEIILGSATCGKFQPLASAPAPAPSAPLRTLTEFLSRLLNTLPRL